MTDTQQILDFDPDTLTLGEMEDMEEAAGLGFMELITMFEEERLTTRALRAVTWILLRRGDPDLTFEDTKNITVGELGDTEVDEAPLAEAASGT
jgi:hypothetical protein